MLLNNLRINDLFFRSRICLLWGGGCFWKIRQVCHGMTETSLYWYGSTDLVLKNVSLCASGRKSENYLNRVYINTTNEKFTGTLL
jgi:hypothetical protein